MQRLLRETLEESRPIHLVLVHIGSAKVCEPACAELVNSVRDHIAEAPIVLLGDLPDSAQAVPAIELGTNGYISTGTSAEIVKHALPIIANGGIYAAPFVHGEPILAPPAQSSTEPASDIRISGMPMNGDDVLPATFTKRELEVLSLLGEGLQNKVIAYRMNLKEGTVKVHVRHIMKKLNVTSRTQAALFAQKYLPAASE